MWWFSAAIFFGAFCYLVYLIFEEVEEDDSLPAWKCTYDEASTEPPRADDHK